MRVNSRSLRIQDKDFPIDIDQQIDESRKAASEVLALMFTDDDNEKDLEKEPDQRPTTISLILELRKNRKKNFFQRNCRPLVHGGIRASSLTLLAPPTSFGLLWMPKV